MPSKSKAQQRFMGLVHAYNKGDVKGSEVSKAVKDAAASMDKSDIKKYASTKHKGKPEKVNKEWLINTIKELTDFEMESCGYVMSAKNPSYKLKSPGGTGEEDKKLKEVVTEGEQDKIIKLLVKYGNTEDDAKQMVKKTYDYIKKAYRNANTAKKAEIMSGLMKFETTEQFSNLVEKCWKGYMIHPTRKTKKLFGKTYPNCVKKENVNRLTEMDYRGFIKYMNDFYGPKGVYPDKKKRTLGQKEIGMAYSVLLKKKPNFEIGFDSTDREMLRDILIKLRKLDPDYSKKESVNENYKNSEWEVYLKDEKGREKIVKKAKSKRAATILYNKIIKSDKFYEVGMRAIKESVKEAVDKKQGAEILNQLGGNRFIMMTGAKHFGVGREGLSFKIGKNSKQVNHIKIDYDRGRDLYNIKFDWVTKRGIKNKKTLKGIYADQLAKVFEKYTGMYTTL